jgi:hypothetical protein
MVALTGPQVLLEAPYVRLQGSLTLLPLFPSLKLPQKTADLGLFSFGISPHSIEVEKDSFTSEEETVSAVSLLHTKKILN